MGYYTDFTGGILFEKLNEKDFKRLKTILLRRFPDSGNEVQIEKIESDYQLRVFGNWKNYHEEMEKFVMAIARAFPEQASGSIDACGEERDDNWSLEIAKGVVKLVTYEKVVKNKTVIFDAKGGRLK